MNLYDYRNEQGKNLITQFSVSQYQAIACHSFSQMCCNSPAETTNAQQKSVFKNTERGGDVIRLNKGFNKIRALFWENS